MSNIAKTIAYLKENPNRFIRIVLAENNQKVGSKTDLYFDDIPYEDLSGYIKKSLGPVTKPTMVYVEVRAKEGATSRKKDSYSLEISPDVQNLPVVQTAPALIPMQQVQQSEPTPFYGGSLGQTLGLGFPEIMKMQRDSDRLVDKQEQLVELKEDLKELKQENRLLEIENRELKTQKSTAEAQKEMAVMMVKAENKSFFDSPAFEKVMEQAPQILAGIASMKTGGATGALGNPSLSATHNELIDYIASNLDENQANYIGSICGLMNNPSFSQELNLLITRYATS